MRRLSVSDEHSGVEALDGAAAVLEAISLRLRGPVGVRCLLSSAGVLEEAMRSCDAIDRRLGSIEALIDADGSYVTGEGVETVNSRLARARDAWWAVSHDRILTASRVAGLVPSPDEPGSRALTALDGWWAIEVALSALDRLEVRGRDSAGLFVMVSGDAAVAGAQRRRQGGPSDASLLFRAGGTRLSGRSVGFVYKTAAEIGELGDNVTALRRQIGADRRLAEALAGEGTAVTVIGHTRWASVGAISEENAHPLDSGELHRWASPYVVAAVNGDVDNSMSIRREEALDYPPQITTDSKVVPVMVARRVAAGMSVGEAVRESLERIQGSIALSLISPGDPDALHLAIKGSGQSLYIGLGAGAYVVASEPYGLVSETDLYLRMDGETTLGQAVRLQRDGAGTLRGISRMTSGGRALPIADEEAVSTEITTRDVDRRGFQHFLMKELMEAPHSFRRTLRGRITTGADGMLEVGLGVEAVPTRLRVALGRGEVRRAVVIGQGTAAVAAQAVSAAIGRFLPGWSVSSCVATELSGFGLSDDMSDTLVVAVSQSGTTTDTNRTVDLARRRGAHVVAIVNRRNSDLVTKSHGVVYTSDGRDIEMSVASTKAFYSQIAAGWLLAIGLAQAAGCPVDRGHTDKLLRQMRSVPDQMERVLSEGPRIARIARRRAPVRRYWAVVGSGSDRIAAAEVRIKLSELCYRSVASDTIEDKKHIDLSSEPLVVVCAAGLAGPNAADAAKEVAIFAAHRAFPVVIAADGEVERFRSVAPSVIPVPEVDPSLAFIFSAMAGHLFGYYAAVAIDVEAQPLRAAVAAIVREAENGTEEDLLERLFPELDRLQRVFTTRLSCGRYDAGLKAGTAGHLTALLHHATTDRTLDTYRAGRAELVTPRGFIADLVRSISLAIDELARPIDAVKHQAKTVTVGVSRSEDGLFAAPLVRAVLAAGATPDQLGYKVLTALRSLDEAVAETTGFTRYHLRGSSPGSVSVAVVGQGGAARGIRSRTEGDPRLRGTKRRAAVQREVVVSVGASDGRTIVVVPESGESGVDGLTLLHVRFHRRLQPEAARRVLTAYRNRYAELSDAVMETEPGFEDRIMGEVPVVELLTAPVNVLARRWRSPDRRFVESPDRAATVRSR